MFRALWFFIKLGLLIAAAVWLFERPGNLNLEWQGYIIETSAGFAALVLFVVLFLFAGLFHLWRRFVSLPKAWRKYNGEKRRTKGYQAITKGLLALAAGDASRCQRQASRARQLLPDTPLTQLLEAQAAQMNGDMVSARKYFQKLLESKEGFFFGVRGLLSMSLQNGETAEALEMARQAYRQEPDRAWILLTLFDLEVRTRNWAQAQEVLARAVKKSAIDKYLGKKHHAAICLAQSDELAATGDMKQALHKADKAQKRFPDFVPIATRRARLLGDMGKKSSARKALKKIWKGSPHPDIVTIWRRLVDEKSLIPTARLKAMQELTGGNPHHVESHIALAEACLDAQIWGMARAHLTKALDDRPDERVYRLLARLERDGTQDQAAARHWLEKAASARPAPRWVCRNTGAVFDKWAALNPSDGSFNTVEWRVPASWGSQKQVANTSASPQASYEPFPFLADPQIVTLDDES